MTAINLIGMDFADIKSSLKNYLKQQDHYKDYDFDGSGLSVLLDVLAFDSQSTAYMANMIANESNIDTAILRENVVSRAKAVGYTPKSKKASTAVISLSINDPSNESTSLLLPRGTQFIAGANGTVFSFVTLQDYNLYLNETTGVYENTEIELFEGTIKAVSWTIAEGMRCVVNNTNIDTDTLRVGVFPSYNTTSGVFYRRAYSLEKVNSDSTVFWVQEVDGKRFEVMFGDGVFGKKPINTNVVYAEFLSTNGSSANGYTKFSLAGSFSGYENDQITISTVNQSNGGSEGESISSIKINAPRAYVAQGKATIIDDYKVLTKDIYPYARAINAWCGSEERPVKYGKVYISVIPNGGGILTDYTKTKLTKEIKSKCVAGINPVFVDAEYVKINMTAYVNIRKNSIAQLKTFSNDIRNLINDFFTDKLYEFDSSFYYSNLTTEIETFSRSITSAKMVYELSIDDIVGRETFDFKNAIVPGTVRSSKLAIPSNVSSLSIRDEDGKLYLGNSIVGSVDYEEGIVSITDSTINSTDNLIEVFVTPVNDDVIVSNRTVLTHNSSRLSVEIKSI